MKNSTHFYWLSTKELFYFLEFSNQFFIICKEFCQNDLINLKTLIINYSKQYYLRIHKENILKIQYLLFQLFSSFLFKNVKFKYLGKIH